MSSEDDSDEDESFDPFEKGASALLGSDDDEDVRSDRKAKSVSWSYAHYIDVSNLAFYSREKRQS